MKPEPRQMEQVRRPTPLQKGQDSRPLSLILQPVPLQEEQGSLPRPWQDVHCTWPRPKQRSHCCTYSVCGTLMFIDFSVNMAGTVTGMSHGRGAGP